MKKCSGQSWLCTVQVECTGVRWTFRITLRQLCSAVQSVQYVMCSVECTVCHEQCRVYSVSCAVCHVQCADCSIQCAMFSVSKVDCTVLTYQKEHQMEQPFCLPKYGCWFNFSSSLSLFSSTVFSSLLNSYDEEIQLCLNNQTTRYSQGCSTNIFVIH